MTEELTIAEARQYLAEMADEWWMHPNGVDPMQFIVRLLASPALPFAIADKPR